MQQQQIQQANEADSALYDDAGYIDYTKTNGGQSDDQEFEE